MSKLVLMSSTAGDSGRYSGVVRLVASSTTKDVTLTLPSTSGFLSVAGHSAVYHAKSTVINRGDYNIYLKFPEVDFSATDLNDGFRIVIKIDTPDDVDIDNIMHVTTSGIILDFNPDDNQVYKYAKVYLDDVLVRKLFKNSYLDLVLSVTLNEEGYEVYKWNVISSGANGVKPTGCVTDLTATSVDESKYYAMHLASGTRPITEEGEEPRTVEIEVPVAKYTGIETNTPSAVVATEDPRLSDSRTPKAHKHGYSDLVDSQGKTIEQSLTEIKTNYMPKVYYPGSSSQTLPDNFIIDCGTL